MKVISEGSLLLLGDPGGVGYPCVGVGSTLSVQLVRNRIISSVTGDFIKTFRALLYSLILLLVSGALQEVYIGSL